MIYYDNMKIYWKYNILIILGLSFAKRLKLAFDELKLKLRQCTYIVLYIKIIYTAVNLIELKCKLTFYFLYPNSNYIFEIIEIIFLKVNIYTDDWKRRRPDRAFGRNLLGLNLVYKLYWHVSFYLQLNICS